MKRPPVLLGVGMAATVVASILLSSIGPFPERFDLGLAEPINSARRWLITNQNSHWLYSVLLNPISDFIDGAFGVIETVFLWIPWYGYVAGAGLGLWWTQGRKAGGIAVVSIIGVALLEVWTESIETLALMAVAVTLSVVIGVPTGILASRSDRFQLIVRPFLDAMQTMPGFIYLIPFVLLFGVGVVPAVTATVIFALPPIVRLTDVGLRGVPVHMVEASTMFGASERQTLVKVRIPQAMPSILAGLNQTIMMAMGMVVIAALIGSGGLGQIVLRSLQTLDVGRAAEAGVAIVIMAIMLDRFSNGLVEPTGRSDRRLLLLLSSIVALAAVVGGFLGHGQPPDGFALHFAPAIDRAVDWAQVELFDIGGSGIGTGPFSDFVTLNLVTPLRNLLSSTIPWPVLVALVAAIGGLLGGWRLALGLAAAMLGLGFLGTWELAMDTLAQCLLAVVAALFIGVPIGIIAAQSNRFRAAIKPGLDFLQTIPSFVLLVPVIMLFNVGRIPGIIASVLYALPAAVHYTDLGLREVPRATVEAAVSFGSTTRQRIRKVELPLAAPQLLVAINQTIMLVLAMVVIAGLVGGGGLGLEAVRGLRRTDSVGAGFEAGIAIVLLATVLDRITKAAAVRLQPGQASA